MSMKRRVVRCLGLGAGCYLGVLVLLMFIENSLVFRPTHASEEWIEPPISGIKDVDLRTPDGTFVHAWWYAPPNWTPSQGALLYCHGNAGNLSHRGLGLVTWNKELGRAVLIFDYPGYGKSGGRVGEAGCYASADAAYDWLVASQKVAPESIILHGRSLGTAVAVDLAARKPHHALVLMSPFTSMPDVGQWLYPWLPCHWLVRNRFESIAKIGGCRRPVFVAHGTVDRLIPFAQGERLYQAANEPKEFMPLPGKDHSDQPGADYFEHVRAFLARHE